MQAKRQLRREMRARRDGIDAETAAAAAERAAEHLLASGGIGSASLVALYAATGSEIDTGPAARRLSERGVGLAYPRVVQGDRRLAFHRVEDPGSLRSGAFGIPEPPDAAPQVSPNDIDAFVIPGLAFDRRGGRLGWGGAYYDNTLTAAPGARRIGFAFDAQLVEIVPSDEGDVAVDCVITEAGVVLTGARSSH